MKEEWRPVVGYEGLYEVSNLSRVKSVERDITVDRVNRDGLVKPYTVHVKERILKQGRRHDGYADVSLSDHGKTVLHCVHRLVAEAWIPNPQGLRCVNHKDLDKTNNALSNLEWVSNSENVSHGVCNLSNPQCIPIYCYETDTVYASMGRCDAALGLPQGSACIAIQKNRKLHGYTIRKATESEVLHYRESLDSSPGWKFEFKKKGRLHSIRKIKCIENQQTYSTLVAASKGTKICADTIRDSIRQKRSAKGLFTFYYMDDAPEDEIEYQKCCQNRYYLLTHSKGNRLR